MRKTYKGEITIPGANQVFVFGSNAQGRHGKGAALTALRFGAIYGITHGRQGNAYAIVTKDLTKNTHPSINRVSIMSQIVELYDYADSHPELEFLIAYSGKKANLNGYTPEEMAKMFAITISGKPQDIPANIIFEESFNKLVSFYILIT